MMDKKIFVVPFVMIQGFKISKRDMKLIWLIFTTLCHWKEVWHIFDSKGSHFQSLSGKIGFYAVLLDCFWMHNRTYTIRRIHSSHHMSVVFDKMAFILDFKPSIDSRERKVIFIDNIPSIFEDNCSNAVIRIFRFLDDCETDRNDFILINI